MHRDPPEETYMFTQSLVRSTRLAFIAVAAACALLPGLAQSNEQIVTLQTTFRTADLDLSKPADLRELYRRLQDAAGALCDSRRPDVRSFVPEKGCSERVLAGALRSINRPQLTMIYLETHTVREAVGRGIEAPAVVVKK
jgi:UrcA family protein